MGEGRRGKILVVDDDAGVRGYIEEVLSRAGFDVVTAVNGADGMNRFRHERVDLAIVDMFMPEKDGVETLMEMRQHFNEARILAISGGGNLQMGNVLIWARKLKANAVLEKPFTNEELLSAVEKVLAAPN